LEEKLGRKSREKAERRAVKEKAKRLLEVSHGRECGECQECCWLPEIKELGKLPYERCPHQCETGCGIYANRPTVCQGFTCFWLSGQFEEKHRPDRIGLVARGASPDSLAYYGSPNHVILYSAVPRAQCFDTVERSEVIGSLAAAGHTVIIEAPDGRRVLGPDGLQIAANTGMKPREALGVRLLSLFRG